MLTFSIRRSSALELSVVLGIIFFLAFVFLCYFYFWVTKAKEMVLQAELRNMRIALNVYKGFNGKYPDDIRELIDREIFWTKFSHEMYKRPYLQHQRLDKDSFPIDPWNRHFVYNASTGKIFSQAKRYKNW
ncbi:MAG: type II secretion system protein GspG [Candidatus Omnitrophica bacterium]|nr:type II secretion system protein GspG [Candidatus Omnitrophota bacterium]